MSHLIHVLEERQQIAATVKAERDLVRAGVPERVAMLLTGHKTRSVFERHDIVSPGDLREAARRLDESARRKARGIAMWSTIEREDWEGNSARRERP